RPIATHRVRGTHEDHDFVASHRSTFRQSKIKNQKSKMIKLLIVEDSVTQREIFKRLFAADGEFTVVAEAGTGNEAIAMVTKHSPDVVLMDIHMPDMDGITA